MAPSQKQWLIPFAVQLIPAGLLFIGTFCIRESPRWLFSKGRREEAIRNLCWIRELPADDIYMMEEIADIDAALEHQQASGGLGFWAPFKLLSSNKKVMYRFFLGGSLFFWQNTSGINAINYYSPTVFKAIGVQGTNASLLSTGIFGVIKTCLTIVWLLILIDRFGRRKLLLYGAFGGSVFLWYVGGYIAVAKPADHPSKNLSAGGKSAMAAFYLWTACYTPSWNGTPWIINSEMFDQNVRTLAQAFAAANNWLWNFLVARFTPQMFNTMGYGVFFFFAALMICSFPFVYFLVPETKGVPLEKMDGLFDRRLPARKAHKVVMAQLRQDEEEFRVRVDSIAIDVAKEKGSHVEVV